MDLSVFGVEVTDLAYDTRTVTPGALFFCIPGSAFDGHDLAVEAIGRGAVALVVERRLELDVPQLIVPSVRAAMGPAAAEFFGHPSDTLEVVAVTGTNGKTTTAFLLHAILDAAGRRPALLTNIRRVVGREEPPDRPQYARGDRPAAPVPRDARCRRSLVLRSRRRRSAARKGVLPARASACSSSRT